MINAHKLPDIKIEQVSPDKLIPYTNNARTHSDDQIAEIAASIKEFGFCDPIAIDSEMTVIAGHGRLKAAKLLGLAEVPVIQLGHLSKTQQKAYILAHNRIAMNAGWDSTLLGLELLDLKDNGFEMEDYGFDPKEIEKLLNPELVNQGLQDEDAIPSVDHYPAVVRGDIWVLGNHRLRCGDATNPLDVQELYRDGRPILMVTYPPYGVNYDPEWRDRADLGVGEQSLGKVENDDKVDWTDAYSLFSGDIAYVWHAGVYSPDVGQHILNCGFKLISQIIWVKQHFALSRGDYHWQHEACLYAVKDGKNHNWQGARDQATVWEIANNGIGNANPEKTWGHGTQKPLECMARPIVNNSHPGDHVYDPFGGSGTTLIACEKHNRKCLMMEISPIYCEVVIKRWQDFTGKQAVLESNGLTYEEIAHGRREASLVAGN